LTKFQYTEFYNSPVVNDLAHFKAQADLIDIRANIHQIGGFSAHADQKDLLNFVSRIPKPPRQVRSGHPPLHSQKLSSSLPATRDLRSAVPTSDATEPRANPGHRGRHARGGG